MLCSFLMEGRWKHFLNHGIYSFLLICKPIKDYNSRQGIFLNCLMVICSQTLMFISDVNLHLEDLLTNGSLAPTPEFVI